MEKLFEKIIDNDEKILKVFKPHKGKFFLSVLVLWALTLSSFLFVGVVAIFAESISWVYVFIPIGIWLFCLLIVYLFALIYYKNLYYAYSNKRLIIRSGIFGVDFKSLDMSMIGAVNVYVSLLDKVLRKDTGSLAFGSTASPMGYGQNAGTGYRFNHIEKPYETCKEVKMFIDNYKKKIPSK